MLKFPVTHPIRLLAIDIDGTLLNPEFQISPADLAALRRCNEEGVEVVVVTGRRHTFAMPIAEQLGFDLWIISSNGAITRSLKGETFHRDMLPAATCRKLCQRMATSAATRFLPSTRNRRAPSCLSAWTNSPAASSAGWKKTCSYIDFVIPVENSLTTDPVQAMFCGPIPRMHQAWPFARASEIANETTVLRTEYAARDLSIVDVLNRGCSKGHALERWANYRGYSSRTGHGHR